MNRPLTPGPTKGDCQCGRDDCHRYGRLSKPDRDGYRYVDGCPENARQKRNRREGLKKQRIARKRAGVPDSKFSGTMGNEENWRGEWRTEVKSGKQAGPVSTRFLLAEKQSTAAKAHGDPRPFMAVFMPEDWGSEGLVVMRLSDWEKHGK